MVTASLEGLCCSKSEEDHGSEKSEYDVPTSCYAVQHRRALHCIYFWTSLHLLGPHYSYSAASPEKQRNSSESGFTCKE
jgi:hypothetical protein